MRPITSRTIAYWRDHVGWEDPDEPGIVSAGAPGWIVHPGSARDKRHLLEIFIHLDESGDKDSAIRRLVALAVGLSMEASRLSIAVTNARDALDGAPDFDVDE